MKKNCYAVLIADVVGSSARRNLRGMLGQRLAAASRAHAKAKLIRLPYSVTAGDEFQTIVSAYARIPELIMDLRIRLRPLQLRIGVGFGTVPGRIQSPVNRLGGEAFQFARKALERIKGSAGNKFEVLTAFESRDKAFNSTANLIYALHDTLVLRITEKQWETIEVFRNRRRLEDAAQELGLDNSTVSRNLKRGYFWQMEDTAEEMKAVIKEHFG
ncbi:MAG: SatD family protein [Candidatus Acidiferrales bacterium]